MKWRANLAMLMGLVALIAIGLGLMRSPSDVAVSACYSVMLIALSIGLLGSILRRDGAFVGFTVFGWLHASLTLIPVDKLLDLPVLPTIGIVDALADRLIPRPPDPPPLPPQVSLASHGYAVFEGNSWREPTPKEQKIVDQVESWKQALDEVRFKLLPNAQRIGYMAMTFLIATVGAMIGKLVESRPGRASILPADETSNSAA
jgi:hypothetical protein